MLGHPIVHSLDHNNTSDGCNLTHFPFVLHLLLWCVNLAKDLINLSSQGFVAECNHCWFCDVVLCVLVFSLVVVVVVVCSSKSLYCVGNCSLSVGKWVPDESLSALLPWRPQGPWCLFRHSRVCTSFDIPFHNAARPMFGEQLLWDKPHSVTSVMLSTLLQSSSSSHFV